jgi:hypothetical protein
MRVFRVARPFSNACVPPRCRALAIKKNQGNIFYALLIVEEKKSTYRKKNCMKSLAAAAEEIKAEHPAALRLLPSYGQIREYYFKKYLSYIIK